MALNPIQKPEWEINDFINNEEFELFDSVASEFNDISGFTIDYYQKVVTEESTDYLYGEDANETYSDAYRTKLVYEPSEEPEVLNVFGISSDDTLTYAQITKTIFKRDVSEDVPKPGDVIQTLWNNKLYEIVEVGSEQKIFQGMKLIWEFIMKPYRHSEESDSAEEMLFNVPEDDEFPDINTTTESKELSAYGDNEDLDQEPDYSPDSSIYGY